VIFSQVSEQANGNAARKLITVSSDVLKLTLDTQGGDIVSAELLAHKLKKAEQPFTLLTSQPAHLYVAQSGLVGRNGPDSQAQGRPTYEAAQTSYQLADGQDQVVVPMTWTDSKAWSSPRSSCSSAVITPWASTTRSTTSLPSRSRYSSTVS
jgi:YidC/Oxa1 family membrane protein insertase